MKNNPFREQSTAERKWWKLLNKKPIKLKVLSREIINDVADTSTRWYRSCAGNTMGQRAGQPGKEKDKLDDEVKTFDK